MSTDAAGFYDDLAEHYHLIFADWNHAIGQQANVLGPLLEAKAVGRPLKILDCACGVGTQTLGLAQRGHTLVATDRSEAAVRRAAREAAERNLDVMFHVADMRDLSALPDRNFDAVLAADNSLPHLLSSDDLHRALEHIAARLRPGGVFLATLRDYDHLLSIRPSLLGPAFYSEGATRRIVHQVWDWDGNQYDVHLYLTWRAASGWTARHFAGRYRAMTRAELTEGLASHGFTEIEWLAPEATGFYQRIVLARKKTEPAVPAPWQG